MKSEWGYTYTFFFSCSIYEVRHIVLAGLSGGCIRFFLFFSFGICRFGFYFNPGKTGFTDYGKCSSAPNTRDTYRSPGNAWINNKATRGWKFKRNW